MKKTRLYVLLIALIAATAMLALAGCALSMSQEPADTGSTTAPSPEEVQYFTNPVAPGADPFVLKDDDGTKDAPLRSLGRAFALLRQGGTVALTQSYNGDQLITVPNCSGPIMITAEHNNVILTYKFIKIGCPVYMENLVLAPATVNGVSVIECNYNDVVMGEGVSCLNRLGKEYAYLVGGKWKYAQSPGSGVYTNFQPSEAMLKSQKAYTITILGGTWQKVFPGSARMLVAVADSAPNSTVRI